MKVDGLIVESHLLPPSSLPPVCSVRVIGESDIIQEFLSESDEVRTRFDLKPQQRPAQAVAPSFHLSLTPRKRQRQRCYILPLGLIVFEEGHDGSFSCCAERRLEQAGGTARVHPKQHLVSDGTAPLSKFVSKVNEGLLAVSCCPSFAHLTSEHAGVGSLTGKNQFLLT